MKKILLISTIIIFYQFGNSQNNPSIEKGERYYNYYNYYKTIEKFEPITDKTAEIRRKLAESYYNVGEYELADSLYYTLVKSNSVNVDDIYNYVKVLLINQKYKDAEIWMSKFRKLTPDDSRAELFGANKGFYNELLKDPGYFSIKCLDFNDKSEDFAPTYYKDKIVFTSSRQNVEIIKRKWAWNDLPFLDLYVANLDSNGVEFESYKKFNFNKKFHEGTVSFNKSGDYLIFTSNNYKKSSSEGVHKLDMFWSIYKEGKWQKPQPMPFNSPEYSVGHPSLSPDGKVLFFSSDMLGGFGKADIYVSTMNSDSTWSAPVNLGPDINTEANEMFPFFHSQGYLFFASEGRPGLGGLDLFVASKSGSTFTNAQNLGTPVNSNFDDFALIIDSALHSGYFSSNRITGKGNDDIYSFELYSPFFAKKTIEVVAKDNDGNLLENTEVVLFNAKGDTLKKLYTDENGFCSFIVEINKSFTITGQKLGYKNDTVSTSSKTAESTISVELNLERLPNFFIRTIAVNDKTNEPVENAAVILINSDNESEVLSFSTDSLGEHKLLVEEIKLNDTRKYMIAVKKEKYLPYKDKISILFDHEGTFDVNIRLQELNIGDDISKALKIKPIYFDLNKYDIRPDAAIELDKIVEVMNEYPTLEIELGSHTDSRGSDKYNKTLSQKRATASAKYIKERITKPARIYGKGYGESKPFKVNKDVNKEYSFLPVGKILNNKFVYKLSKKRQKTAHQLNRRTEFKIIKY